jgi:nucleotide-binding universal stress UspA family protein
MDKILIAIDGSPASHEAVEFGVELAAEQSAAVIFVHVVRPLDVVAMSCFGIAERQPLVEAKAAAEHQGVEATAKLLIGDTVDEIVASADNLDVDLIVIGSRGHGTLTSALLGSVSQGVVSESKRPVLIIRGVEAAQPQGSALSLKQGKR